MARTSVERGGWKRRRRREGGREGGNGKVDTPVRPAGWSAGTVGAGSIGMKESLTLVVYCVKCLCPARGKQNKKGGVGGAAHNFRPLLCWLLVVSLSLWFDVMRPTFTSPVLTD